MPLTWTWHCDLENGVLGTLTVMCPLFARPWVSFSASEWCVLKDLVQILQPLEEATQKLSAEQRVSCSKVIPLLNAILVELQKNVVDKDEMNIPDDEEI